MNDTLENRKKEVDKFEPYIDEYGVEYVKNKIEPCLISQMPRLPEDIWGIIGGMEENPWEIIKRMDDGIYPRTTPLHFVGEYAVDDEHDLDVIATFAENSNKYNIVSLELLELISLEKLPKLPESLVNLYLIQLESLTEITNLPHTLKYLVINNTAEFLDNGSESIKLPTMLESLELERVTIEELPDLPDGLKNLKLKSIDYLTSLQKLPPGLRNLTLEFLDFDNLIINSLPEQLQSLTLVGFSNLSSFLNLPFCTLKRKDLDNIEIKLVPY